MELAANGAPTPCMTAAYAGYLQHRSVWGSFKRRLRGDYERRLYGLRERAIRARWLQPEDRRAGAVIGCLPY
jgi:hypothetical protein